MNDQDPEDPLIELARLIGQADYTNRSNHDFLDGLIQSEVEPEPRHISLACIHVKVNGKEYPMFRELTDDDWDKLEKLCTRLTLQKVLNVV